MKKKNLSVRKFNRGGDIDPYDYDMSYFETDPTIEPEIGKAKNSNALGYIGAGLQAAQSGMASFNAIDDTALDNQIAQAENIQFTANDNSNLLNQWNNYNPLETDYKWKDVGFDWGEQLGNTLNATLSGAATGNIWGAAGGLAIGLAGNIAAGIKANNQVKEAEKEAKRINLVNQNKFLSQVDTIEENNDLIMKRNSFAKGGNISSPEGFSFINEGGTHEQNPFGGVPIGIAEDGSQNLVEEGEVIYKDYVFSNRLKSSTKLKEKYKITDNKATFAETVKELIKPYEETMDDPISKREIESIMSEFTQAQEEIRMKKQAKQNKEIPVNVHAFGDYLKYAPMVANAAGLVQNVFTPADYTYTNKIENTPKRTTLSKPTLLTNRYNYTPTDYNYLVSKSLGQAAATRASLLDTANNAGAARANLLAADMNAQDAWSNIYLKAKEAEDARRLQAEQFNLGIDQFNAQVLNTAAQQDAQLAEAYNQRQLQVLAQAAQLRSIEDQAKAAALGTNTKALADNAYQLYKDEWYREQANKAIENGDYGVLRRIGAQWNAYGGSIRRKNRKHKKGLTY